MTNTAAAARLAVTCILLILMHFTIRPLLDWRVAIDFLLIALLFGSVRMRPAAAAVYGLLLGLATDSLSPGAFGASALAATVVGFSSSWLKAVFFADNLALNALFLVAGKWVLDLVYILMARQLQGLEILVQLTVWSPLAAIVTAVAGILVMTVLRPVYQERTA